MNNVLSTKYQVRLHQLRRAIDIVYYDFFGILLTFTPYAFPSSEFYAYRNIGFPKLFPPMGLSPIYCIWYYIY